MQITKVMKCGEFYKVKFDNEETYKFHESIIISYGFIRSKIEVSSEKLSSALIENEYYLALEKGIKYCYSTRCEKEVFLYLLKHYDKDMARRVILKLNELKLINDKEYAKEYVAFALKKCFGPKKIHQELKELNIIEEDIQNALEGYTFDMAVDNALKLAEKYSLRLKKDSKERRKAKLHNYLLEYGFNDAIITITLEKVREVLDNISSDEELLNKEFNKLVRTKKDNIDDRKFKQKVIRNLSNKGFALKDILKLFESRC